VNEYAKNAWHVLEHIYMCFFLSPIRANSTRSIPKTVCSYHHIQRILQLKCALAKNYKLSVGLIFRSHSPRVHVRDLGAGHDIVPVRVMALKMHTEAVWNSQHLNSNSVF
jgi:hypothetical protein